MTQMQLKRTVARSVGGLWGLEPTGGEAGIAVVRVADFDYSRLTVSTAPTTRIIESHLAVSRTLRMGDLLIEKSGGGDQQNVGRVVRWTGRAEATFSNFVNLLRPARHVESRWLAYLHRHLYATGVTASCTKQTTGIQNLDLSAYLAIRANVPALEEQQRVADFLDRESERIGAIGGLLADHHSAGIELERRAIDDLFAGVPLTRLGWRAHVQTGLTLGGIYKDEELIERPYLRVANVQADAILTEDVATVRVPARIAERTTLRPGDVLMTEGGDIDKLGRGAVWDGSIPDCLHQNHVFAVRCGEGLLPRFLAVWTRSSAARSYFERTASRITNIASTNLTKLVRLPVPDLPIADQRAKLQALNHEHRRIHELRKQSLQLADGLAEYRDALVTEAVTGKLDVGGLSDQQLDESARAVSEGSTPEVLPA